MKPLKSYIAPIALRLALSAPTKTLQKQRLMLLREKGLITDGMLSWVIIMHGLRGE